MVWYSNGIWIPDNFVQTIRSLHNLVLEKYDTAAIIYFKFLIGVFNQTLSMYALIEKEVVRVDFNIFFRSHWFHIPILRVEYY